MPVFSSPDVAGRGELVFDVTSGATAVEVAVSSQLASVRAALSVDRAARFNEVRL